MTKQFIINTLKANKQTFKDKFNITKVGLFGSYAKEKNTPQSDIDIVYRILENKYLGFKDLYDLEVFFQQLFVNQKVDLVEEKYMNPVGAIDMEKDVIYV